jgi:predicted O-linked N-acetylglucosamine transferase (SPINDLY family)
LVEVHNNLGGLLSIQNKFSEAIACYQQALTFAPNSAEIHNNLGIALKDKGLVEDAIAHYRRALEIKLSTRIHSALLLTLQYSEDYDPVALFAEHQRFNKQHILPLTGAIKPYLTERNPWRQLKIGYLSQDFRRHSVVYFIEPLLAHHDHQQFEIFCYYNNTQNDAVTQRLQQYSDHWCNCVTLSDEALVGRICADQIDIMVDLMGHTSNRMLVMAKKPAPVQVAYLGYSNTTGLSTIDYRITDGYAEPEGVADKFSSEVLVRMPDSYFCYRPADETYLAPVGPLPALQNGYLTFGSFNIHAKLSPTILSLWAQVLHALPHSKLFIKAISLNELATRQALEDYFAKLGVTAERLILTGYASSMKDHLNMYHQVDIALDSYPYNGATTTCETLWMGVPVVTLVGETPASRMGLSILATVGLTELIAQTKEEYVNICLKLAGERTYLQQLRAGMRYRLQSSPLMAASAFTRHLESVYRKMWVNWCTQE